jgi:predicted ester cyclase
VVQWSDQVISEIEDGRIAEEWLVTDLAEQLLLARK